MIRATLTCLAAALLASTAQAQDIVDRSTLTLSAGGATTLGSPATWWPESGPAISATYEYRLSRFFAFDGGEQTWFLKQPAFTVGTATILSTGVNLTQYTPVDAFIDLPSSRRTLSTMPHLGARAILPLAGDRFELYAGGGPGYVFNPNGSALSSEFVLYTEAGARVALDRQRRFWLGASSQYIANYGQNRQQYFSTTFDFGIRFGRNR